MAEAKARTVFSFLRKDHGNGASQTRVCERHAHLILPLLFITHRKSLCPGKTCPLALKNERRYFEVFRIKGSINTNDRKLSAHIKMFCLSKDKA